VTYSIDGSTLTVSYRVAADGAFDVRVDDEPLTGRLLEITAESARFELGGVMVSCDVHRVDRTVWVNSAAGQTTFVEQPRFPEVSITSLAAGPTAPVPGRIVRVDVEVGEAVTADQTLVVMEAMKVEHRITAGIDGRVAEILVTEGMNVDAHQLLVRMEAR
jgi:propionyl-CoA carboxylase alpha chain